MTTPDDERARRREERGRRREAREDQMTEGLRLISQSPEMSEAVLEVWAPEDDGGAPVDPEGVPEPEAPGA